MSETTENTTIILFDGVCNFCNSCINFIIRHDKLNYFRYATLQSKKGKELLEKFKVDITNTDSIILIENNKAYIKSTAALRIVKHLNKLYPLLVVFIVVPALIRNWIYDLIAKHRYKWFGKRDVCMIPDEKTKALFLE